MKLDIERDRLAHSLNRLKDIIDRRGPAPILEHILLQASGEQLHLRATNLDLTLLETIPATCTMDGSITTRGRVLHDVVSSLPTGSQLSLSLEADGGRSILKLGAANCQYTLETMDPAEFPDIPQPGAGVSFRLTADQLHFLLQCTRFSMPPDDTRDYLNGVFFHVINDAEGLEGNAVIRMVATDSHRLSYANCPAPAGLDTFDGTIIPKRAVQEILRLVGNDDDTPVSLDFSTSQFKMTTKETTFISNLVNLSYPKYRSIIPRDNSLVLTTGAQKLHEALRRVDAVIADRVRVVRFSLADNTLTLRTRQNDIGSGEAAVEVDHNGEPFEIGLNISYIQDILTWICSVKPAATIRFLFKDNLSPLIVRSPDIPDVEFVVVPTRL